MIALNFDDTLLERATSAAATLEGAGQFLQLGGGQRHAGDGRHRLAASSLAFTPDPRDAVTFGYRRLAADAGVLRLTAGRAVPPGIGGKDQPAKTGQGIDFLGHGKPRENRRRASCCKAEQFNSKLGSYVGPPRAFARAGRRGPNQSRPAGA